VIAPALVILLCSATTLISFNRLLLVHIRMHEEMNKMFAPVQKINAPTFSVFIDGKREAFTLPSGYYGTRRVAGVLCYALC